MDARIQSGPGVGPVVIPQAGTAIPVVAIADASGNLAESPESVASATLSAASAIASGAAIDLLAVRQQPVWQLTSSAALTGTGTIVLQGSLDGVNWYTYATVTVATAFTAASTIGVSASVASPSTGVVLAGAAGDSLPARFVRANIATANLVGGTITVIASGA